MSEESSDQQELDPAIFERVIKSAAEHFPYSPDAIEESNFYDIAGAADDMGRGDYLADLEEELGIEISADALLQFVEATRITARDVAVAVTTAQREGKPIKSFPETGKIKATSALG